MAASATFILIFFVFAVATVNAKPKLDKSEKSPATSLSSSEEMFQLHEKAKKEVDELNKKYPGATFEINKFSFMSHTERKKYLSTAPILPKSLNFGTFDDENITAPESFDYRDFGQVTSVKNQGDCGSCYAFGTTGAVESQYLIHKNQSLDLSEEYLLECDKGGDQECVYGYIQNALNTYNTSGVPLNECVPYTAQNGTCPTVSCEKYKIDGYKVLGYDEDTYPGMLFKYGPIVINIAAGSKLQAYKSGVLDFPIEECGTEGHIVLLVGYTEDYWIAKNSWGSEKWGENGYFRFKRGINWCDFSKRGLAIPFLNKPVLVQ